MSLDGNFYSIVGIIALIVIFVLNKDPIIRKNDRYGSGVFYRAFLFSVFGYIITDICWGFLSAAKLILAVDIDTFFNFVTMASSVVLWSIYVANHNNKEKVLSKILTYFGLVFFVAVVVLLILNWVMPDAHLFYYFVDGVYTAGPARDITDYIEMFIFGYTLVYSIFCAIKAEGKDRSRTIAICACSIVMGFSGILQLFNPFLPGYACGYLVGISIHHIFVFESEIDDINEKLSIAENEAREALRKEEIANKAKTAFLFNMSHDIRTPMNAIMGYTDIGLRHSGEMNIMQESLKRVQSSSEYLLALINDVLDMARIESGKVELIEEIVEGEKIIQELSRVLTVSAVEKDLRLEFELSSNRKYIYADKNHVNQVMMNIISNAIKYTNRGGVVRYFGEEIECEKPGYARFRVTVEDNGIGMSKEFLPKIFDDFEREKTSTVSGQKGTGLGMSIVKRLVDLMGGQIFVESELGKGTKITLVLDFRIPSDEEIEEYKKTQVESEESKYLIKLDGIKVLLVEDNEINIDIAKFLLEEHGAIVDTANDGDIAVEKMKNATPGQYDIILMDVQMPRMDGYEATRAIRNLDDEMVANIPIIAMTANAFAEDKMNAFEAGMNDHISKPINTTILISTISKFKKSK